MSLHLEEEIARLTAERDDAIARAERAEIDVECYLGAARQTHRQLTESEASVLRILGKLVDAHKRIAELEARAASRGAPTWIGIVDGQIPPGRWLVWDATIQRTFAATSDADGVRVYRPKGAFNLDNITHYCAAVSGPGATV